jgi:transposase
MRSGCRSASLRHRQYGDSPQAVALLSSLAGVGHVIADAAYDADPLRAFIVSELGATA